MKIVIATPLFPPDIGGAAPYIKELVKRLSKKHAVTVVTYAHLPEKVAGVSFISVNKRRPLLIRLLHFTFVLWKEAQNADMLYAENGPSVELPVGFIKLFIQTPLIIHIGDDAAHKHAAKHPLLIQIERFAFGKANKIIDNNPPLRPAILPFESVPQK